MAAVAARADRRGLGPFLRAVVADERRRRRRTKARAAGVPARERRGATGPVDRAGRAAAGTQRGAAPRQPGRPPSHDRAAGPRWPARTDEPQQGEIG